MALRLDSRRFQRIKKVAAFVPNASRDERRYLLRQINTAAKARLAVSHTGSGRLLG